MKKYYGFLMGLLFIGGNVYSSFKVRMPLEEQLFLLAQELNQTASYDLVESDCKDINHIQLIYHFLKKEYFLPIFPLISYGNDRTIQLGKKTYRNIFQKLSTEKAKNLLQKVIFSYGNGTYATQGRGLYICQGSDGLFQAGTFLLKGRLRIEEKMMKSQETQSDTTSKVIMPRKQYQIWFDIQESFDPKTEKLPYVVSEGGTKKLLLGCTRSKEQEKPKIYGINFLRKYYNIAEKIISYNDVFWAHYRVDYGFLLGKNQSQDIFTLVNQDITMKFYLLPNYLPAAGDNFSECANSWLDAYEIVGA